MTDFTIDTPIMGVSAGEIAAVVDAKADALRQDCYDVLLAIAQAIRDMTLCADFGGNLQKVLEKHFPKGKEDYRPVALQAVKDVFLKDAVRCPGWRIYRICPFDELEDLFKEQAPLDPFFEKCQYLGGDGIDGENGCFYFGRRRVYRVQIGLYKLRSNAKRMYDYAKEEGLDVQIGSGGGLYRVLVGAFYSKENAENYAVHLLDRGFAVAILTSGF